MTMFIFTSILMVSLSAVLYLVVRALPRIAEEPAAPSEPSSIAAAWKRSEIPEKIDRILNGFLFKFFRKLKVMIMKIDNTLSRNLQRMKLDEVSKKNGIDFKDIAGQNKEGE